MLSDLQLIERDQPLIVGGEQVIQDLCFRSSGEADAIGKRAPIARESVSDIPRTRADRVAQLLDAPVLAFEVGRQQKQIDAQVEKMGELPGREIAEIDGSRHAGRKCNRPAATLREESRVFRARYPEEGEEIEPHRTQRNGKICRSTTYSPSPEGRHFSAATLVSPPVGSNVAPDPSNGAPAAQQSN